MSVNQVVGVITVRHRLVTTVCAVLVLRGVAGAIVPVRAVCRIPCTDFYRMFINVPVVEVMQVSIMQVVDMIVVLNRSMPAVFAVVMCVLFVNLMFCHCGTSFLEGFRSRELEVARPTSTPRSWMLMLMPYHNACAAPSVHDACCFHPDRRGTRSALPALSVDDLLGNGIRHYGAHEEQIRRFPILSVWILPGPSHFRWNRSRGTPLFIRLSAIRG